MPTPPRFHNRIEAGRHLAESLRSYAGRSDVIVLGLPRGGVPVAAVVASALGAPLDVFLVRKIGVPGHPEYAMGAIAESGVKVLSTRVIADLGIPQHLVDQTVARERMELDRRDSKYRGTRRPPSTRDRVVILVDDGLATGSTMEAAIVALRQSHPSRIVVAAPVGARETCARLKRLADEVVCPLTPELFSAVGQWYDDFSETPDEEVTRLLMKAPPEAPSSPGHSSAKARPAGNPLAARAWPMHGTDDDYDRLVAMIGDARVVLIGEATHGTREFYRERAALTRRLIEERGFSAVAVEADWPDSYRVNRYVRGQGDDRTAMDALADFQRFPAWMWRNTEVREFVEWLRTHNEAHGAEQQAGFYGLDLYSLGASKDAVVAYLAKVDPDGAERARVRYACFDRFGGNMQHYGYMSTLGLSPTCEREAIGQLVDMRRRAAEYASRDGRIAPDEYFFAEQNARLVRNAEEYYRAMFGDSTESWNLRDRHMADTLTELMDFLGRASPAREPRVVVWAHNSHIGDARATSMGDGGELNIGQLARDRFGAAAFLIGQTTFHGTVTAASAWDGPAERKHVRDGLPGSIERLLHDAGLDRAILPLRVDLDLASMLRPAHLERAIGVLYLPETERRSHYFHARLSDQFDAVIHLDRTHALEPLERTSHWDDFEVAETYPSGL